MVNFTGGTSSSKDVFTSLGDGVLKHPFNTKIKQSSIKQMKLLVKYRYIVSLFEKKKPVRLKIECCLKILFVKEEYCEDSFMSRLV